MNSFCPDPNSSCQISSRYNKVFESYAKCNFVLFFFFAFLRFFFTIKMAYKGRYVFSWNFYFLLSKRIKGSWYDCKIQVVPIEKLRPDRQEYKNSLRAYSSYNIDFMQALECALQDIVGEQRKNSSVTSCFGFHKLKVESDAQPLFSTFLIIF